MQGWQNKLNFETSLYEYFLLIIKVLIYITYQNRKSIKEYSEIKNTAKSAATCCITEKIVED